MLRLPPKRSPFLDATVLPALRAVRKKRDDYLDPTIHRFRGVARQMERGEVDVLFLGDSSATFFGADDTDPRRLPQMLAADLDATVATIAGPGFPSELHAEFVRLLATLPQRPRAVVFSICVRTSTAVHVRRHPQHGHARTIATLRRARDTHDRLPTFSLANHIRPEEHQAFAQLEVSTAWGRGRTVGDFLAQVTGRRKRPESLATQQALFDYLHGETVRPGHPELTHVHRVGELLREYGVPVVVYWPPVPVERGEEYFPGEFAPHVRANHEVIRDELAAALGPVGHFAATPLDSPDTEFIDPRDGSEHWNEAGRRRMARVLAAAIADVSG